MTDRHYVKWFVHIDWLTGLPISIIEVCFINFMNFFFYIVTFCVLYNSSVITENTSVNLHLNNKIYITSTIEI